MNYKDEKLKRLSPYLKYMCQKFQGAIKNGLDKAFAEQKRRK